MSEMESTWQFRNGQMSEKRIYNIHLFLSFFYVKIKTLNIALKLCEALIDI